MKILDYGDNKKLFYDEKTSLGRVVDLSFMEEEINNLKKDIEQLEKPLKSDKELLGWAKQFYGEYSGLDVVKKKLENKEKLLGEIK